MSASPIRPYLTTEDQVRFIDRSGHLRLRYLLADDSEEFLAAGADREWVLWYLPDGPDVRVRLEQVDARMTITGIAILGTESHGHVRAVDLRELPLGRLEDVLNDPRLSWAISSVLAEPSGPDYRPDGPHGLAEALECPAAKPPPQDYRLFAGSNGDRGDTFYSAVAGAWATAIAYGHKEPSRVIAEANGVPASTVHRWVREARRRRLMAASNRAASTAPQGRAMQTN